MTLKEDASLFISLGQEDGRLVPGAEHPFPETIHHTMFSILRVEKGDSLPLKEFQKNRIIQTSTILEYKENALDLKGA